MPRTDAKMSKKKPKPSKLEAYGPAAFEPIGSNLNLECLGPPPMPTERMVARSRRCNGFVVMVTVSSGYYDFFANWLHHARKHINLHSCLRAVAEDRASIRLLRRDLSPGNILLGGAAKEGKGAAAGSNHSEAFEYGSKGFGALVRQRPRHIASFLRQGIAVIYSDIDLVWASNPLPALLAPALKNGAGDDRVLNAASWSADFIVMDDNPDHVDKFKACPPAPKQVKDMYLCTCLFLAAPTAATIELMDSWVARMEAYSWTGVNQFAFNLAAARMPRPIAVKYLNRIAFPSGRVWMSKSASVREQAQARRHVMHANFVSGAANKRALLRSAGMWADTAAASERGG